CYCDGVIIANVVSIDDASAVDPDVVRVIRLPDPQYPAGVVIHVADLALDAIVHVTVQVDRETRAPYARRNQHDAAGVVCLGPRRGSLSEPADALVRASAGGRAQVAR